MTGHNLHDAPLIAPPIPHGLHPGVPFEEYLHWPILSQSVLKEGRASMAHLRSAMDRERVKEVTDDMLLGQALHTCFLEPELMATHVVRWEGGTRRGKAWDEFCAENTGRTILTEGRYENLIGMVRALRRHPFVREWASKIEHVECSVVGTVHGVTMKGRCDALTPEPLVDLKKVRSADPATFTKTVLGFGYDLQAFIYRTLFNRERFVLLAVEGLPPYDVVAYELSPAFLRRAESVVIPLLDRYKFHLERGDWPGRADDVIQLEPPEWLMDGEESEVKIGGAAAFEDEDSIF